MHRNLELMAELTASSDRDGLDRGVVLVLISMFGATQVTLATLREDGEHPRWQIRSRFALGETDAGWETPFLDREEEPGADEQSRWLACLRAQRPLLGADDPAVTLWPLPSGAGSREVLEVRASAALSPEERAQLAAVLRIYRNMVVLIEGCERDALTGLRNRSSFEKTFLQAASLSYTDRASGGGRREDRRSKSAPPQWLGVLDIDHFKQVNDAHGHVIGDEVLVLVARIMNHTFRACDRLYRFGGEEFVVLLSAPDEPSAGAAFERLRAQLEAFAFPRVGRVTASIGFTGLRRGDLPQSALERADRAVYHGKRQGRNQVHGFDALVAQGRLPPFENQGTVELFARLTQGAGLAP